MVFITNSELESRLKASRKRREQEEAAYARGATDVAGWNDPVETKEDTTDKRSFLSKAFDQINVLDDERTFKQNKPSERKKSVREQAAKVGGSIFSGIEKTGDALEALTGIAERKAARDDALLREGKIDMAEWRRRNEARLKDTEWAGTEDKGTLDRLKKSAGVSLEATSEIVPFLKGAKAAQLTTKGGAVVGGLTGLAHGTGGELADDNDEFNVGRVGLETAIGTIAGAGGGKLAERSAAKKAAAAARLADNEVAAVDGSVDDAVRSLDAEDAFRETMDQTRKPLQIDAGQSRMERRLAEIDQELNDIADNPNTTYKSAGEPEELITGGKPTKTGELDMRSKGSKTAGTVKLSDDLVDSSDNAARAKALSAEKNQIVKEMEGLRSIEKFDNAKAPKLDINDPQFKEAVDNELQAVENSLREKATGKINALTDYFRTPTKVLRKIGLKETADTVEQSFTNYRKDLYDNMKVLADWRKRAGGPDSAKRIFNWLDGDKNIKLAGNEQAVANEMQQHFKTWADKLGLPEDARVSDYITHIFEGDLAGKTNDVTLNSILEKTGTKKVYNPFTQKRLGKEGYVEDAFQAMEAYMRKSTRQLHMEPALKATAEQAKNVDERTARYLLKLNQSMAMKPDKFEQIVNDVVGSVTGDKFGPQSGTRAMRAWRNTVYRATLGGNIGSALRNLTQGTNTFAELGGRYTLSGYSKLLRTFGEAAEQKATGKAITAWDELVEQGILDDAINAQDRNLTAAKTLLKKVDRGLWAMFDTAERINRGSAYFGAKAKALAKNMPEEEAIAYAKKVVGDTQFRFNDIETPLALRSQVTKTLGQFQSFNLKQAEFLGERGKDALTKRDAASIAKIIRWTGANLAIASTIGTVLGLKWNDAIPDFGAFRGVRSPLLDVGRNIKSIAEGKNEYGQEESRGDLLKGAGKDLFGITVPAGTQIKKSKEGLDATNKGGSFTDSGKLRYTVGDDPTTKVRGALFGQYNLDEGQNYFAQGREAFTDKQTELIESVPSGEQQAYEDLLRNLGEKYDSKENTANKIREEIKNKNFQKAQRLAKEHNDSVEAELSSLGDRVGRPPKDIVDYIRRSYKVDYTYYLRNKDEKK